MHIILKSLRENDISIRRRALDILYLMASTETSDKIVQELLNYSEEWADILIKEELVLKIAILAERFAENLQWYIDVVVRLVSSSGDYITDDIWFRIIQMITGFGKESNPELQKYAAQKLFNTLRLAHVHETLVAIGSYVLSEYSGYLVELGKEPLVIFETINKHYPNTSEKVKAMILNSYAKLAAKYADLKVPVMEVYSLCGGLLFVVIIRTFRPGYSTEKLRVYKNFGGRRGHLKQSVFQDTHL